ncbi:UNVERIFIED_CONTAM: hypothetical protein Sangu_2746200 [Sesamum angustifolium]|uniref:Uncharacterized protein n=1 Tax=Sesamum angustifolium TaxID=2727405 RepID=A0AAW2IVJ3_9LAMI
MNQELLDLERNQTKNVVLLLFGKRTIGCKWVYKLKLKDDELVERYKARLVAKGYTLLIRILGLLSLRQSIQWTSSLTVAYYNLSLLVLLYRRDLNFIPVLMLNSMILSLIVVWVLVRNDSSFLPPIRSRSTPFVMRTKVLALIIGNLLLAFVFSLAMLSFGKTKKQCTVSHSSAEAEYHTMAATMCELKWISYLLRGFGVFVDASIPLHCDNQATIHIMANHFFMRERNIWILVAISYEIAIRMVSLSLFLFATKINLLTYS